MDARRRGEEREAHQICLAVSWLFRGRMRVFAPRRWVCVAVLVAMPLVGAWYFAATLYLVFHDQLLASLITRQTDMQYAYEDQIAVLRTQLDRETSRGLVDRQTLETTVRDLRDRGALLEARGETLDRLVSNEKGSLQRSDGTSHGLASRPGSRNLLLPSAARDVLPPNVDAFSEATGQLVSPDADTSPLGPPETRRPSVNPSPRNAEPNKRADMGEPSSTIEETAATFDRVERAQDGLMNDLRQPRLQSLSRLRAAILSAGLSSASASESPGDVGGPFVPLPANLAFEQNAAFLRDADSRIARLSDIVATIPLLKPLEGAMEVSSTFGPRVDPFLGRAAMHTGIDFREGYGESVHATAGGIVAIAGSDGGYGTMVEIDHGNGLATRYAHLSNVAVIVGQKLTAGAIVGHVGSSGRATGPHLHYETRINGEPVDPTRFLKIGARLFDD